MTKNDFDNKLTTFNRKITSNKTKYLEVQKKVNSLITKDYNFFLGKIYFTSNYGSWLCSWLCIDYVLSWKSNWVFNSNLSLYILLSYIA